MLSFRAYVDRDCGSGEETCGQTFSIAHRCFVFQALYEDLTYSANMTPLVELMSPETVVTAMRLLSGYAKSLEYTTHKDGVV